MIPRVEPEGMLFRKPVSTPDQVRGRLFRNLALSPTLHQRTICAPGAGYHACRDCHAAGQPPRLRTTGLFMSARKLVVVVDDDKTMLRSLERLLNASGFDTEVFS